MINKNNKKSNDNLIIRVINKIYKWRIFNPFRKKIEIIMIRIEKSIRFELMVVIAICFVCSFLFYAICNDAFTRNEQQSKVVYDYDTLQSKSKDKLLQIEEQPNLSIDNTEFFNEFCNNDYESIGEKIYITDLDGNILYKSNNVIEDKVDIFILLTSAINDTEEDGREKKYIYPISIGSERYYFIFSDTPTASIHYSSHKVSNSFLALMLSVIVFIIIFISITNTKMKYLDEIAEGLKIIANEDIHFRIREEGNDEIRNLASNINYMANEINNKIELQKRSEQTKTDLITNVSHDLRTPLTSIMGYIGLVKEGKYDNDETMKEYLNIAFNKSEKLKMLIEDLFEYTKLNNSGIKINKQLINLTDFIFQLSEELIPLFDENDIKLIKSAKVDEKIMVLIDPDKMLRVFENLLSNAVKYSYKPGNIILSISKNNDNVLVVVRNKSDHIPAEKLNRIFDRFYRVDESRNAQTGGTGLGLAISKNIVELHGGKIWAECYGNNVSFYVKLKIEKSF